MVALVSIYLAFGIEDVHRLVVHFFMLVRQSGHQRARNSFFGFRMTRFFRVQIQAVSDLKRIR
jgi:hypothetical protein